MYKIKLSNTKAYANPSDDPIYKQKQLLNHPEDKYDPLKYSVHYNTIQEENDKGEPDSPSHINRTQQLVDLSFNRLVKSSQSHIKSSVKFRNNESLSEGRNSFSKKSIQKERKEILEIKELNEYSESKEKGLVVVKYLIT